MHQNVCFRADIEKVMLPATPKKRVSMDMRAPKGTTPYVSATAHPQRVVLRPQRPVPIQHLPALKLPNQKSVKSARKSTQATTRVKKLDAVKPLAASTMFRSVKKEQGISWQQQTLRLYRKWQLASRVASRRLERLIPRMTPNKLVYGSLMSGVAFGMVSLSMIETTFNQGVDASQKEQPATVAVNLETTNDNASNDVLLQYFSDAADADYQAEVRKMVKGYPIEEMLPEIFAKDRVTAAFLIGIAKKESNWGKRHPVLDGQDCFNYWGYRGQRRLMGSGGHTCFNSRKDAVDTVATRIDKLVNSERLNTPAKLIVWKCGFSCEGHSRESVQKWIADVDAYYSEMMALEGAEEENE
jgi:hypothetical protein